MKRWRIVAATALGAFTLAGCATEPATQVTRFHLGQPIARGQITVEPLVPAMRGTPEFETYAGIVAGELARNGFNAVPNLATSEQVAAIAVEFGTRSGPPRGGLTLGLGVGGGSYGYRGGGVGGGAGVSLPVSGGRARELTATRLIVQIKRRSDGTTVWEGRAETVAPAGSPAAQPADAVARLTTAVFAGFPGISGRTITVK